MFECLTMSEDKYHREVIGRTVLAVMQWMYVHPNQKEAQEALDRLPAPSDSFEEHMAGLRDLGVVTAKTYEGLI